MDYKHEIKKIALQSPNEEVCGYVLMDCNQKIFIYECKNYAPHKDKDFLIDEADYVKAKWRGEILMCYHSHPYSDENPSHKDRISSDNSRIPYLIYSLETDTFFLYFPEKLPIKDLVGRVWVDELYQCTSLVEDFYIQMYNLNRNFFFENHIIRKSNDTLKEVIEKHFIEIDKQNTKHGDLLCFKIPNQSYMHLGIFIKTGNDDCFLHQITNGLSAKENLSESWMRRLCNIYRLKV